MEMVDADIEQYALTHTTSVGAQMDEIEREARGTLPSPEMLSGAVVGRLLQTLVFAMGAERVLEIGTYAGYSALAMAEGLAPGGELITCEISPQFAQFAQRQFAASPYGARIRLLEGPALDTVAELTGPFDLVFIDADKTGYRDYYEATLPKLAQRGLIVFDNTLRDGAVLEDQAGVDEGTRAMTALNNDLANDERVVSVLLTVRDGMTIVRRR